MTSLPDRQHGRDVLIYLSRWGLLATAALPVIALLTLVSRSVGIWTLLLLPAVPLLVFACLVPLVRVLRAVLPAIAEGPRQRSDDPEAYGRLLRTLRWHNVVQGTVQAFGLTPMLLSMPSLFRAYLRAAGAQAGRVTVAHRVDLGLPSLLRLDAGAYLGWGVQLSGYLQLSPERILIAPIRIGAWAFIGMRSAIAPGCSVGQECVLGPECLLADRVHLGGRVRARGFLKVGSQSSIGAGTILGYEVSIHPGVTIGLEGRIGNHVVIGRHARIGENVRLGDHVIVGPGVSISSGTRVPAGTRLPAEDREQRDAGRGAQRQ